MTEDENPFVLFALDEVLDQKLNAFEGAGHAVTEEIVANEVKATIPWIVMEYGRLSLFRLLRARVAFCEENQSSAAPLQRDLSGFAMPGRGGEDIRHRGRRARAR